MNFYDWSFPIGRIRGIRIRVHWLHPIVMLLLFAADAQYFSVAPTYVAARFVTLAVVFLGIILLHELGHCFAARRLGGSVDKVLLWPLGGLAFVRARNLPSHELIVGGAGPLVNVVIGGFLAILVVPIFGFAALNPLASFEALRPGFSWLGGYGSVALFGGFLLHGIYWCNVVLLAFNLIPAYPMDGGRILRGLLGFRYSFDKAVRVSTTLGIACGGLMVAAAFFMGSLILGFIGLWTAWYAYRDRKLYDSGAYYFDDDTRAWGGGNPYLPTEGDFGSIEGLGPEEDEEEKKGFIARWLERRREAAERRAAIREAMVRERLDAILDKISREGMESLSDGEKEFLQEASERYRARAGEAE